MNIKELAEKAQSASVEAHKVENIFMCLMQAILKGDYDASSYEWAMTDIVVRLGDIAESMGDICETMYAELREKREVA